MSRFQSFALFTYLILIIQSPICEPVWATGALELLENMHPDAVEIDTNYYSIAERFAKEVSTLEYSIHAFYDDRGKLLIEKHADYIDNYRYEKHFFYENDRPILVRIIYPNETSFDFIKYDYSTQTEKETDYDIDGNIIGMKIAKRDDKQREIEVQYFNSSGIAWITYITQYNNNSKTVKSFDENGSLMSTTITQFSENGKELESKSYNVEIDLVLRERTESIYDQYGNLIRQTTCNPKNEVIRIIDTEYSLGRISCITRDVRISGYEGISKEIYTRDNKGSVVEYTEGIITYKFGKKVFVVEHRITRTLLYK